MSMSEDRHLFGPIPSRRLGLSLGISPILKKTCNYSCVYCQLGRTNKMTNERQEYVPLEEILAEFRAFLQKGYAYDVITIVGEGEPTLALNLGQLIIALQELTDKPIAVITNSALLSEKEVRAALMLADIVLPSLDAYDEKSFRKVNRPYGRIKFYEVYEGMRLFSQEYLGQLWLEVMLVKGLNEDQHALRQLKALIDKLKYDRLYLNIPVRAPAESWVSPPSPAVVQKAAQLLGAMTIDSLADGSFYSEIVDNYEAVLSIIGRHPMNQHEIEGFLASRKCVDVESVWIKLKQNEDVEVVSYKGYDTYRLK